MEQFMNMLVMALLSGSPAHTAKPATHIDNWPALKVTEHIVAAMPSGCGANATGCTVVNFGERTCDIYVAWREPLKAATRERELRRCRGYDDPPFRLKTAYVQWLSAGSPCKLPKEPDGRSMIAAVTD
ncbi:MAG TPA: hypothetical protein VF801_01310 [Rhodocyclaceae bacterium]